MSTNTLTPFATLTNAELLQLRTAVTVALLQNEQAQKNAAHAVQHLETEVTCVVDGVEMTVAQARIAYAALQSEARALSNAIKQAENDMSAAYPQVMGDKQAADETTTEYTRQLGLILAELDYRKLLPDHRRDVGLGRVKMLDGRVVELRAREVRNHVSWRTVDPFAFLAAIPADRQSFFTVDVKFVGRDVGKGVVNEWVRGRIAAGESLPGLECEPMVLARVNGDDPLYFVDVTEPDIVPDVELSFDL